MQSRVYNSVNELKVSQQCDFNSIVTKEILSGLTALCWKKGWCMYIDVICIILIQTINVCDIKSVLFIDIAELRQDWEILLHCLNSLPLQLYLGPREEAVCDGEDVWAQSGS